MSFSLMDQLNGVVCKCGKIHSANIEICVGPGVINQIPEQIARYSARRVFVLSDTNTYKAAGEQVCRILQEHGVAFTSYIFSHLPVEPDEYSTGTAFLHFDSSCDMIIAIGSGVVNDIGKLLSVTSGKPYMIVATAPSMDGYASASSSMTRDGLKISLPSRNAEVIIGDTQIMKQAPMHMMVSGLGDMLAKYISICEWRIAELVVGEYYCEQIAQMIRSALKCCVDNAQGLLSRDEAAVQAVFEGLVISGIAMNYAGLSRPASGVEHYISHVLDMRAVEFGTEAELHGIQCAVGTFIALKLYEKLKHITPDREKALAYAEQFNYEVWSEALRALLGNGANSMIALEAKERKYDLKSHKNRFEVIAQNWNAILNIIDEELPDLQAFEALLKNLGAPTTLQELGTEETLLPTIFKATKDIRDKYVLSRLCWDLGIIDEIF